MNKHHSPCRCCRDVVSNISKRHDPHLGTVCPECFHWSAHMNQFLLRAGIEGSVIDPDRSKSQTPEAP